ncbi:alpha-1,4-glucan--maltose-1-phosphate maltosyltransferase [Singulisphaera sp. PoT]|uniref:alpha-1,4-glucan--maltose-1-phosphate maltosyltransferase n=1 Tax=Singulisphaera sp. PoT TaxID=3411797 RepID=UPI003BF599BD
MHAAGVSKAVPSVTKTPSRVIIEGVEPEIDDGRFPIKRTVGESVVVFADIFAEGHDKLDAVVRHRKVGEANWNEVTMTSLGNDRWSATFDVTSQGRHEYTVQAWVDHFASWRYELGKKAEAGQDVSSELLEGAEFVREASTRAEGPDRDFLAGQAEFLRSVSLQEGRIQASLDPRLLDLMIRYCDRSGGAKYERILGITVERERARFGSWYEFFPRSAAKEPGKHGTFKDAADRLDYVASMGFDVVYLPPIHPIGSSFRKGPNNTLTPGPDDPGSPWAIGAADGGHKAVLKDLGTLEDFDKLVARAKELNLEIALDIAFQCSPDHPYVKEHPEWFKHRPDGTIKYAENPPKKYQDIYPINFECEAWESLWAELRDVFLFWVGRGVKIFRVDNPHTKPFRFWEWVIREVWDRDPDTIFLSEAFTRPKMMRYLAKSGYSQSYSYFTWRNNKWEITEYFTELTQTESAEYMRPNLFANTPDILHDFLQHGGRPAFQLRHVLAATLGATYGIYGPPFELCVGQALRPGSEEYLDSEKYQVRYWNLDQPGSLREFITRVNQVRRENPALQFDRNLRFHEADNPQIIVYSKSTPDGSNQIIVVVNLDPYHVQSAWVHLNLGELGLGEHYQVQDLIDNNRYEWHGASNFVRLDPLVCSAHIFRVSARW